MSPGTTRRAAWLLAASAATVLALAEIGLVTGVPMVGDWFYNATWWSFIALLNAAVHLRTGSSLLLSRPRAFLLLLPWSAAFWLFFEAVNFILQNWYYVNAPRHGAQLAVGIGISFATVLPGIYGVAALIHSFGGESRWRNRPFELTPRLLRILFGLGVLCLVMPLFLPRFGFPLIWASTLLLIEPVLAGKGRRCLLLQLARGEPGTALRYLGAGLVCGVLWEFWNYWADSKWIYTVPFFEEGKLFEMPLLGFLGFPPFALECYSFGRALVACGLVPEWEEGISDRPELPARLWRLTGLAAAVIFSIPVAVGVGRWTVHSVPASLTDLPGMEVELAARLESEGVESAADLAWRIRNQDPPEALHGVPEELLDTWADRAELMEVKGLGPRGAAWLKSAGVVTVPQLADADPVELAMLVQRFGNGPAPPPGPAEIRVWVRGARKTLAP